MRTTILAVLATGAMLRCNAQELKESEVPANVKDAFAKTYPAIKGAEWEKEGDYYEAEFKLNGKEQSVVFDAAGKVLETEVEIPENELPTAAKEYLSKNYKGIKIKEVTKITTPDGKTSYEAEVDKKDLIFDASGKFVKIEEEKGEKDQD